MQSISSPICSRTRSIGFSKERISHKKAKRFCDFCAFLWRILSLRPHDTNIRKVPVALPVIEPISYDELIRDFKTNVLQIDFDNAAGAPIQQRADLEGFGISAGEGAEKILECEAGVYDIFDNENILASNILFQVFRNPYDAFTVLAITGNRQEIHRERQFN